MNGLHKMIESKYHEIKALSKSGISRLLRSPAHFQVPVKVTDVMRLGTHTHVGVLEEQRFKREYEVLPEDFDGRTNIGKALVAQIEAKPKVPIKYKDAVNIEGMKNAVFSDSDAKDLLSHGEFEISGFWTDLGSGILCKMRIDWLNKRDRIIVDLKTTTDARYFKFLNRAYDKGYNIQAAFYLWGLTQIQGVEHRDFQFIVVETEPPYGVQVYPAEEEMIEDGLAEASEGLEIYKKCLETDTWPCYEPATRGLGVPGWKKKKEYLIYE